MLNPYKKVTFSRFDPGAFLLLLFAGLVMALVAFVLFVKDWQRKLLYLFCPVDPTPLPWVLTLNLTWFALYSDSDGGWGAGVQHFLFVWHCGSECLFFQRSAYVILLKPQQKGRNFQFKMHNIKYSLDNVSHIYWTKSLYHMSKIQMSNFSE